RDLQIEGFRVFSHLSVERLGRVNLVVGRNNSGKSTLLEAVHLWSARGARHIIRSILETHDELGAPARGTLGPFWRAQGGRPETEIDVADGYTRLFHGWESARNRPNAIQIGPTGLLGEQLNIQFGY